MRRLGRRLFFAHSLLLCALVSDCTRRGVRLETRTLGRQYGKAPRLRDRAHGRRLGQRQASTHRSRCQRPTPREREREPE